MVRRFGADAGLFYTLTAGRNAGLLIAHVARLGKSAATDLAQRKYQAQGMTLTLEDEAGKAHIVSTAIEPSTACGRAVTNFLSRAAGFFATQ